MICFILILKQLYYYRITVNFILSSFIRKANILLQTKSNVYTVTDIDKKFLEYNKKTVNQEIEEIRLCIRSYTNDMQFNIILISKYNVILELLQFIDIDLKISF